MSNLDFPEVPLSLTLSLLSFSTIPASEEEEEEEEESVIECAE
jgi:hypothetical protein